MANKVLTLQKFQATRKLVKKGKKWCADNGLIADSQNIAEYAGRCHILVLGEQDFEFIIANEIWRAEKLEELEPILYREFYLPEIAGVPREEGVTA